MPDGAPDLPITDTDLSAAFPKLAEPTWKKMENHISTNRRRRHIVALEISSCPLLDDLVDLVLLYI